MCDLADASFQTHAQQLLGFDGKLHGKLSKDLFAKAVDNQRNRLFRGNAALLAVKELILTDF